jgi:hypothetical protein
VATDYAKQGAIRPHFAGWVISAAWRWSLVRNRSNLGTSLAHALHSSSQRILQKTTLWQGALHGFGSA